MQLSCLLDHRGGAGQESRWDRHAERFRGLEIDHEFEKYRLLSAGFAPLRILSTNSIE